MDLVQQKHWHGSTPLFEAARSGHTDMVKWLVAKGADPDSVNEWGDSPVNEAASMGHWDVVWYLADRGANLTRTAEHAHNSLVLSAVRHRTHDALEQLLKRGVDLSARHWNGNTVLHEAARMGETPMLEWLISHAGLDVNATNDAGESALAEAAMMGHNDAIWKLIGAGAGLGEPGTEAAASIFASILRHANTDLLDLALARGSISVAQLDEPDRHGRLPLIEAVRTGDLAVVEWLLQRHVNVSRVSDAGDTPLAVAAYEDKFHVMWRLHEAGAALDALNEHGGTVLMSAVHFEHEDDIRRLLDAGIDVNRANSRGDTPLTLAAAGGKMALIELLVQHGADGKPRGGRQDTPLIRAAKFRRVDAVRFLLSRGLGHVDDVNRRQESALLEACRAGSVGVAEELLKHGAKLDQANVNGLTPLLAAAEAGSLDLVTLLAERGADVHARTKRDDEGGIELSKYTRHADELRQFFEARGVKPKEDEHDHEHDPDHGHGHGHDRL